MCICTFAKYASGLSCHKIIAVKPTNSGWGRDCVRPKQASFENMFVSLYVSTYITEFASISWPSNRGPFGRSQTIWKENTLFIVAREK